MSWSSGDEAPRLLHRERLASNGIQRIARWAMMELLAIDRINLAAGQFVPPFFDSLVAAARAGESLEPRIRAIVSSFGFESFEYGMSASLHADAAATNYYYSTVPEWTKWYGERGYMEVDPRLFLTCPSAVPLVWDQNTVSKYGSRVQEFIKDARSHRIASGVSFMWHGPYDTGMFVALNSAIESNDDIRLTSIQRNLPDIVMFGHYFHEVFVMPALQRVRAAKPVLKPLSKRESQCIDLAARGMTTNDISAKLSIKPRTVQFHFARIFDKLGAVNRQEAIARAVRIGIVRSGAP